MMSSEGPPKAGLVPSSVPSMGSFWGSPPPPRSFLPYPFSVHMCGVPGPSRLLSSEISRAGGLLRSLVELWERGGRSRRLLAPMCPWLCLPTVVADI